MTPERWQQIEQIFYLAQEREPSQRDVFLSEACGGELALRREVESLLAAYDQPDCYLETLQAEVAAQFLEDKGETMVGRMLGRYQILAPLGAGGMGEVYRALDTRLDREVAVKILPAHLATSPEALLRFEREAKAVAALSHPNILAIHDFGAEQGVNYAVMELLNGETLRSLLAGGALPWRKAVTIGIELAEGLSVAHAKGITHRDLKPENIFLTSDGRTKILDFGLARIKPAVKPEEHSSAPTAPLVTDPGIVLGTLGYMSPEQVRGEHADAPSDIFSFGCVLFEMVTGQQAFKRKTATESLAAILRDEPPALADARKLIPQELEVVMTHCLEKNPTERFQSASDLAFALRTIVSGTASTRPFVVAKPKTLSSRVLVAIVAGILLVGLMAYEMVIPEQSLSLVVLPFDKVGTDADTEHIADGITEGIINSLTQLSLEVMARTTAFSYKDQAMDPRKIGRELGVRFALTGKAVLRGDSLSIQAELVDVATGLQIWSGKYEPKRADILAVQAEIVREISAKLRLRLTGEQQQRLTKRDTQNLAANDLYFKGLFELNKRDEAGNKHGIDYFRQAIAFDPNYARAYSGLAQSYILADGWIAQSDAMDKARAYATKALQLDESLSEAHTALAVVQMLYDWKFVEAEQEFKRALELNPNDATAHHWYAEYLTAMGRSDQARVEIKKAQHLDPLSAPINRDVAWHDYCARKYDEAIIQCQSTLVMEPGFVPALLLLGRAYLFKGRPDEALAELRKVAELEKAELGSPSNSTLAEISYAYAVSGRKQEALQLLNQVIRQSGGKAPALATVAATYAALGDTDSAFFTLEQAYQERAGFLVYLKVQPVLDSLHTDPRFRVLEQRVGLAK